LKKLIVSASDYIGQPVTSAVITVPTNFSQAQKDALAKAATKADLEVLQFIHEPVAAVLAYDARSPVANPGDKTVLVVDIGGTRSDVAVIASKGGIYTNLATAHDYEVAGTTLDNVLAEYIAKEYLKKNKSAEDPRKNERSLAKLRLESEAVKKALSLGSSASFSVESLSSGIDYTLTINRTRYELLASKPLEAITRLVLSVVEKAELDPMDITDIILAGGSSHTPRIAVNLKSAFPPHVTVYAPSFRADAINPSELSARGAAFQANLIAGFDVEDIKESSQQVITATPHLSTALGVLSISASEEQGIFTPIIEAITPVPIRRVATFAVPAAGGDVLIKLVEATSSIITKPAEKKPKENGNKKDDEGDSDEDSDEEEEEDIKEKKWAIGKTIAEAAIKGVKKGGKVEVQVNIGADLAVTLQAREVGVQAGVRGVVPASSH
jgi:molecular chaperone DnaK (HSP70)